MTRRMGSKNKTSSTIVYPRKCLQCEYISNNPVMYHYHKKTHGSIPEGKLCDHGCGQAATVINTNGKYTCMQVSHRCPAYIEAHSTRVKQQWKTPDAVDRKKRTKEKFLKSCCNNPVVKEKQKVYLKEKWGDFTPEQIADYRHYARRIRARAQRWAKSEGILLGKQTFHVDHKLSIWDAWKAGLSENIVNHPANLQILSAKENNSKGAKSSLTVQELLNLICQQVD